MRTFAAVLLVVSLSACAAAADQAPVAEPYQPQPKSDAWWVQRHGDLLARTAKGGVDLLFLGDSITQGWDCRLMLADPATDHDGAGRATWERLYAPRHAAEFAIGGDGIQHLLWRITAGGEVAGLTPRLVVLMIGTNNLADPAATPERVAAGIGQAAKVIGERLPMSRLLLLGVFPRGKSATDPQRERVLEVNRRIATLDDGARVRFLDIGPAFCAADGTIDAAIMPDFLHPGPAGYEIWATQMEPLLSEMLTAAPLTK